jgi:outer membrane protein assembly factor BamB
VPGGQGDTIAIDHAAHRVERRDAAGNFIWATPLEGYLGLVRPPHLLTDALRVYVTHADGVTALDARTGAVAWHSPGPADRMLLSGGLLLATDCSYGEHITKSGRWVLARNAATGAEVFRVGLPAEEFDPLPIEDAAGLILVQKTDDVGGDGLALLIDHAGQVRHRFDRQVVAARLWAGGDRLVLTSRDVVRLSDAGEVRWAAPFPNPEWLAGGGFVPLPGDGLVVFLYGCIHDSGVQVMRLDPATGRRLWGANCDPLGVLHSSYNHKAVVDPVGGHLRVTSRGSYGTFVEVLDARDGHRVSREPRGR